MATGDTDYRALLARALTTLEEQQRDLEALRRVQTEPIAVIGIGCRLPGGADSPDAFWDILANGLDVVGEVPHERWDADALYDPDPDAIGKSYTRWGAFLNDIDRFDPQFFGISPREAVHMDPQQRLLLEVAWEALEHAGQAPSKLVGSQTGVFVGMSSDDYGHLSGQSTEDLAGIDVYTGVGLAQSIAAGRISYTLGFHGPSLVLDTACSSSLVAALLACQSLRQGDCDMALAGGVNVILLPAGWVVLSRARMMSFDGRCKTFDASADGFVRGEGCGMVVLKRLSDALASGDRVLAVILGGACNQDGRSNGLTAPNGQAQEAVLRAALANAGVAPSDVSHLETHGTGTSLGDPIEMRAIEAVYGEGRAPDDPLIVTSVKTNVGHMEAAAGVVSLIKVVLALRHELIPPHLHLRQPNPLIDWDAMPVTIPVAPRPWSQHDGVRRMAGVSAFGFSGTNVHLIVAEAPAAERAPVQVERPVHALTLSARSDTALRELAGRYDRHLAAAPDAPLADSAYTANTGRSHFAERLAIVATSAEQARQQLADWLSDGQPTGVHRGTVATGDPPDVAFLFTGQGSQVVGMGRELYETQPAFRQALDTCAELLQPHLELPLLDVLYPKSWLANPRAKIENPKLDITSYTQPALFAFEYALVELWRSWGVQPTVVLGHSVGEFVAACVAGVFSLQDGLKLIAERGRLMGALPPGGAMAAVFADESVVSEIIADQASEVAIAALNGPANTVISGAGPAVQSILARLAECGIKAQPLNVSHAFHSPLMDPILDRFSAVAAEVTFAAPAIGMVSNLTGTLAGEEVAAADYWRRHVRAPVRFADGVRTVYDGDCRLFLEIGPQPTLIGMAQRCLPHEDCAWLPSLRRGRGDWQSLLEGLAELYVRGLDPRWAAVDDGFARRLVTLPTYPFQRQRYWRDVSRSSNHHRGTDGRGADHPLLERRLRSPSLSDAVFETTLWADWPTYLTDHRLFGTPLFPAAAFLEMALAAGRQLLHSSDVVLHEVALQEALVMDGNGERTVHLTMSPTADEQVSFQIHSLVEGAEESWRLHASGMISRAAAVPAEVQPQDDVESLRQRCTEEVPVAELYQEYERIGLGYGPSFQAIDHLWRSEGEAVGRIHLPEVLEAQSEGYVLHPVVLDACTQIVAAAYPRQHEAAPTTHVHIPMGIDRYQLVRSGCTELWCYARVVLVSGSTGSGVAMADLRLFDDAGAPVGELAGLRLREVDPAAFAPSARAHPEWLYEIAWQPEEGQGAAQPSDGSLLKPGQWLILADRQGLGRDLAARLAELGSRCLLVVPGQEWRSADGEWTIDPSRPEQFERLLDEGPREDNRPLRGVVHLWSLDAGADPGLDGPQSAVETACRSALYLVQALVGRAVFTGDTKDAPRLWLVTQGAQPVSPDSAVTERQAPLWGLGRTVALEHPELRCTLIDLDPAAGTAAPAALLHELGAPDGENQTAWRASRRHVARLARVTAHSAAAGGAAAPVELDIAERGVLDNLALRPQVRRRPAAGEVEIQVRATGLNFRDVLNAMGMYPGDPGQLGGECAGVVSAVGDGVTEWTVGDEVIALAGGTFKSFVVTSGTMVFRKPSNLSMAEAATIPITFLTAAYGFRHLAAIKAGDRVLIHAAAGGVGMAAVQLARQVGATVFGTAGSPEKRAFLQSQGVAHVMSSRTLDFADEIMAVTDGQGVNIVLNSLADEFIPKSLSVLADGGHFLEIGKRGVWDASQVAAVNPTLAYHLYDLAEVVLRDPELIRTLLHQLLTDFETGALQPLPLRAFPIEQAADAFRFMAQAKHIGKIVITQPDGLSPTDGESIRADSTYLITGGLGGLGLKVAEWLVERGARHLVLMGRHGASEAVAPIIHALEESGARIVLAQGDVAKTEDVQRVLRDIASDLPPLRGVIHAAGVLDDGILLQQTWPRFEHVMAPKIDGAWNLHTLTHNLPLDFFVLFSTGSSLLGALGQGNYAAANAFLDGLAHFRRAQGLAALSINWGAWSEVGMAAALGTRDHRRWTMKGLREIRPEEGIQVLEQVLHHPKPQVAVLPIDWSQLAAQVKRGSEPPLLRELVRASASEVRAKPATAGPPSLLPLLEAAAPEEQMALLWTHVQEQIVKVLALDPSQPLDPLRGLSEMGMDSLTAVELANRLRASLGKPLPTTLAFEYPTVTALVDYLATELLEPQPSTNGTPDGVPDEPLPAEVVAEVEGMSDTEAADSLLKELEEAGY